MAGRPTDYKPEYNEQAYKLCLLGATDAELGDFFGVKEQTINNWKKDYPEFFESIKKGKQIADSNVADRLYQRALGYEHDDLYIAQFQGQIVSKSIKKYYPPDPTAAIFWLKNRQSAKWRDKQEIDFKDTTDYASKLKAARERVKNATKQK
jgi:DNA-binding XRE family transcriptional regulator